MIKWIFMGGVLAIICLACSANLLEPVATNTDTEPAKLEDARIAMDDRDYGKALKLLNKLSSSAKTDSNNVRVLLAAAQLGNAGFEFWATILEVFEDLSSTDDGGLASILEQFSDGLLGSGSEREARIDGLAAAIATLRTAPDPDQSSVANLACFFAGVLTVPTVLDAQKNLDVALTAMRSITQGVSQGGPCSGADQLTAPLEALNGIAEDLTAILAVTRECPFLDPDGGLTNDIEKSLNRIMESADLGCRTLPTCPTAVPNCHELFPSCVQDEIGVGANNPAAANDKNIAACEILLHCTDPALCFE